LTCRQSEGRDAGKPRRRRRVSRASAKWRSPRVRAGRRMSGAWQRCQQEQALAGHLQHTGRTIESPISASRAALAVFISTHSGRPQFTFRHAFSRASAARSWRTGGIGFATQQLAVSCVIAFRIALVLPPCCGADHRGFWPWSNHRAIFPIMSQAIGVRARRPRTSRYAGGSLHRH